MSGSLELPMRYVYLAIPVGALLALLNTIAVAVDPPPSVIVQAARDAVDPMCNIRSLWIATDMRQF